MANGMTGRLDPRQVQLLEETIEKLLDIIGADVTTNHFLNTPKRVAQWWSEMAVESDEELDRQAADLLNVQFEHDDMPTQAKSLVMVTDVNFTSLCAHHLLPFYGRASIAYLPQYGQIVGVSKLARVLKLVAKRPTVQEVITDKVADLICEYLSPHCMVVLDGVHECMRLRGVEDPTSRMVTSAVRGHFATDDSRIKNEFLQLIGGKK